MGPNGLSIIDVENLRLHYAMTLDRWAENYERNIDKVREMFDESFVRCWRLFLRGSSAGFRHGGNRLYQVLFSKGLNNNLPLTRDYLYGRFGNA
jgi:cyclopropane-fatty-acyl-phospholipid synthase